MDFELIRFRLRRARGSWRVETWEAGPPYGPAWQPAFTGALTIEEARAFFDTAAVLVWADADHLTGSYTFAGA